jgi:vacuolar-type H+-ATPase subunit C/Vma6
VGGDGLLVSAFALEADLANVLTALRFAHSPREREALREKYHTDDAGRFFIEAGRIPPGTLSEAAARDTVPSAVEALSGTLFDSALRAGVEVYSRTNRLSDIERKLRQVRLVQRMGMIEKDPLGIGVTLGYIALKVNEIGNLRWIAHGLGLGLAPDAIKADLELVT